VQPAVRTTIQGRYAEILAISQGPLLASRQYRDEPARVGLQPEARHQHHGSEAVDGGDPVTVTDNRERSFTKNRTATKQELKESARGERLAGAATCLQTAGTASYHTGWVSFCPS